jgi:hypothetical protein
MRCPIQSKMQNAWEGTRWLRLTSSSTYGDLQTVHAKFATIYEQDEIRGVIWTADILKVITKGMAARGILRVEDSVRKEHAEKKVGANKTKATGLGVNDYSSHAYEDDAHWEEHEVKRDGEPRCDSYGHCTALHPAVRAAITTTSTTPIATDRPRAKATEEARAAKAIRKAAKVTPRAKATDAAKTAAKARAAKRL